MRGGSHPKGRLRQVTGLKSRQSRSRGLPAAARPPRCGAPGAAALCLEGTAGLAMLTPELPASQPQSLLAPHTSPSALPAAPQAPRPATPILPRTRGAQVPNNLTGPWNCPIVHATCTNHPARLRKDCPATAENAQASREQAAWPCPASGGRARVEGSCGGSRGHVGTDRLGGGSAPLPGPGLWPGARLPASPCVRRVTSTSTLGSGTSRQPLPLETRTELTAVCRGLWTPAWPPRGSHRQERTGTSPRGVRWGAPTLPCSLPGGLP